MAEKTNHANCLEQQSPLPLMIVEDDAAQLKTLSAIMRDKGFEVNPCRTAAEAMEYFERDGAGVVVLDLHLPDANGMEVLRKLADRSGVPIILHTAFSSFESARDALNLGAFAYVEKGGDPDELLNHVHRAMESHLHRRTQDLEDAVAERTRELQRAEETLRRELELRRALLDNLPCAAMILKKGTREIVFSNKKARTMFGAVPGQICYEVCAERDDPCPWCLAPEVWATNEPRRFESEYRGRFYEGIWLPHDDETYIHFIFDITDRKQAEEELAKHRDHLEELVRDRTAEVEAQRKQVFEASRLKSEFLATMSHELRTPLNSIMALSQLMLSAGTGGDCEKDAEFLSVIERNGRNLLNLINDILDLSTIEAGKIRISPGEFAFSEMVDSVLAIAYPMAEAKVLRFEVDLADIPLVYSDKERIKQILLNLLGNAVKFTEAGQIAVTASESGGMISIAVADTGIGISPDVLPHVFDSFRQADGSNTRKYEGTGLGLAISQKLAGLLGGQITVTSELGKGSTFTLRLPVRMADVVQAESDVAEATDADPARSAADRDPKIGTGAILVVEDNADNLLATVAILDDFGYECVTAVNGELAISAARTHAPVLILMDIQLPVMDGLEVARQIKADAILKDIPVVALTAKAMKGDREEILDAGCDDYLSKPIDPESMRQVLHKWLN